MGQKKVDYEAYIAHQAEKLTRSRRMIDMRSQDFYNLLKERIEQDGLPLQGLPALCLGARLGAEVRLFRDLGAFAVGVDINPGYENPYVLWGDFHALEFPDRCVGLVFTNCLDHSLCRERVIKETHRVLVEKGLFITELVKGQKEGYKPDKYDVGLWNNTQEVLEELEWGFEEQHRLSFKKPWPGTHIVWRKREEGSTS